MIFSSGGGGSNVINQLTLSLYTFFLLTSLKSFRIILHRFFLNGKKETRFV